MTSNPFLPPSQHFLLPYCQNSLGFWLCLLPLGLSERCSSSQWPGSPGTRSQYSTTCQVSRPLWLILTILYLLPVPLFFPTLSKTSMLTCLPFKTVSFNFPQVNLWKEETKLAVFLIIILHLLSTCLWNYPYKHLQITEFPRDSQNIKKMTSLGTSLVVQWLRLHSQCRGPCSGN